MSNNLKICVQKFLPEHRHIVSDMHNSPKLAAAFYKKKIWPSQTEIFIAFMDDGKNITRTPISSMNTDKTPIDKLQKYFSEHPEISIHQAVKQIVTERIQPLVNLKFTFINKSEIKDKKNVVKISFDPDGGAWSLVGTDAVGQKDPTMNLGWFDVATVMHEFGHVLGLVHEHQNNKGNLIKWNDAAVYEWAAQTQGWDKKTTQTNILNKYANDQINGSDFDPLSVMLYFFPAKLTLNHHGTHQNLRLSGEDVIWIEKTYPGGSMTAKEYYPKVYGISLEQEQKDEQKMRSFFDKSKMNIILLILGLLVVLGGIGFFLIKLRNRKHKK